MKRFRLPALRFLLAIGSLQLSGCLLIPASFKLTARTAGWVIDSTTQKPIEGVVITHAAFPVKPETSSVKSIERGPVVTNANGYFEIEPESRFTLDMYYAVGYQGGGAAGVLAAPDRVGLLRAFRFTKDGYEPVTWDERVSGTDMPNVILLKPKSTP
ncbi:MAG TPA: hypothetical protein VI643_02255 [Planctomycetota bacterium]|nr:hypothetical protein [Planctomycetota bacterium]